MGGFFARSFRENYRGPFQPTDRRREEDVIKPEILGARTRAGAKNALLKERGERGIHTH